MASPDPTVLLNQAIRRLEAADVAGAQQLVRQVLAADRRNHQASAILGQIATEDCFSIYTVNWSGAARMSWTSIKWPFQAIFLCKFNLLILARSKIWINTG